MTSQSAQPKTLGFGLWRYALIGAVIAFAGPPIYIHTPDYYGDIQGLDIVTMGAIFLALRFFDLLQDPFLGWLINRHQNKVGLLVGIFAVLFGVGMICLFAPTPLFSVAAWFAMSMALVFTGFSGLQILFYSTGLEMAEAGGISHARIAAWREGTVLVGISAACVAPFILIGLLGQKEGYWAYSLLFLALLAAALWLSRPVWKFAGTRLSSATNFWHLLSHKNLRWLMVIGFLNSIPTGITSTLFLWYSGDRLGASEQDTGVMLLVFFICAAIAAPLWGRMAARYSAKSVLMTGMLLVVPAFILAAFLGEGDIWQFYLICVLSGFALGSDMTLLPAMLSDELNRAGAGGSFTFGIWGFITKFSFAVGLGLALMIVGTAGFDPDIENSESALRALALTYALLPCGLKLLAVLAVWRAPLQDQAI